jgi:hypothetical protein
MAPHSSSPLPPDPDSDFDPDDEFDGHYEDDEIEGAPSTRLGRLRRRRRKPRKRLSQILDEISTDETRSRISVADLLTVMSGRAIGALLLLFALPNALPAPPGMSAILGLPLVYLSAQMMLGRLPWLPPFIANRSMSREDFAATISRATPIIARAEKLLKPRLSLVVRHGAERVIGALCLVLAIVLLLPIPLGNMLPAFAICLLALGVLERDGVWVLAGVAVGAGSLFLVAGVVYALFKAAIYLLVNAF